MPPLNNNPVPEPYFRTRVINMLNKVCAEGRRNILVRLPQPNPMGHGLLVHYTWTASEASIYLMSGTLPNVNPTQHGGGVPIWILDATTPRSAPEQMPEMLLDPAPDFARYSAMCILHFDGVDSTAWVPSSYLDMVRTGVGRVRFELNERGRSVGQPVPGRR